MIKALTQHKDGRRIILIGLSEENLKRLRAGHPIMFDCADLGLAEHGHIAIVSGATEQDIADDLRRAGMTLPN